MSYVQIEKIRKTYHDHVVLKDVSFTIEEGEFLTLLGPSGCGKSTLLRAIAGLNDIDAGRMIVGGRDITRLSPKDRHVGMVFQSYALFPNMNVFENIAFGLKMEKMKKSEYTPLVEQMIEIIDLKGKEHRYPSQLSGGQQQRVGLGRSLVKRPNVLLLDEPLSALDAKIRRTLRSEIRQLQKKLNMTTIFVTHDQEEALTVSDRIIVMNNGEIEQQGEPEDIYTAPATEFVARFIGSYNVWSRAQMAQAGFAGIPAGELFAVRPEVIALAPADTEAVVPGGSGGSVQARGIVKNMTILGNVIRFTIEVGGLDASVDMLNDNVGHLALREGTVVRLTLPAEACRPLRTNG